MIVDGKFFEKYRHILISIFKYYSNLFSDSSYSVFLNLNGFTRLLKDCGLLCIEDLEREESLNYNFPFNVCIKNKITRNNSVSTSTRNEFKEKIRSSLFSFNTVNLIFSKFSSEIHNSKGKNANKKLNFLSFIKLLMGLSNKLFNPSFNQINIDQMKDFNIDLLLNTEMTKLQKYFENFILNYLQSVYAEIKSFIEKELDGIQLLEKVLSDERVDLFFLKLRPSLEKIFKHFSDGRERISFEEFSK